MIKDLKILVNKIIPSIHNLPQVIYIRWMDRDWYIRKIKIEILFGFISIWFCWRKVRCFGEVISRTYIQVQNFTFKKLNKERMSL